MNKEIEEMMLTVPQKIVAYDGNPAGQHLYGEQRQQIAEALYNAGYRKVPDGAVVLTKEECDSKVILDEDHFLRVLDNEQEKARKETAKRIYEKAKKKKYIDNDDEGCYFGAISLDDLADICGMGVEE